MKISTFSTMLLLLFSFQMSAQESSLPINTGGTEVNYNGDVYITDSYFDTGSTLVRPQTGLPEPYQSFRYSRSQQMSYAIPMADGEYTVNLYFAELWFGATGGGAGGVGSRVFDVNIEGALAEDNLDVFAEVGADAMLIKTHTVTVTGGVLNIIFDSRDAVGGERHPIINAIKVLGQPLEEELIIDDFTYYRSGGSSPEPRGILGNGDKVYQSESNEFFTAIVANVSSTVKSVHFELLKPSGDTTTWQDANASGDLIGIENNPGEYTLIATPFSEENLGGAQGDSLTVSYEILNHCEAITIQSYNTTSCNLNDGYAILRDAANNWSILDEMWVYDQGLEAFKASNLGVGSYIVNYENHGCFVNESFVIEANECPNPDYVLRINAGGNEINYNGETFTGDNYFDTGSTLVRPQTGLPEPYQSFRYSRSQQMSYDIPLEDGEYTVNLYFAELWFGATGGGSGGVGSRVFDVNIEGALAEDNLDVFAEAGANAMLMKTHIVTVTGGVLNIDFDSRDAVGGERHPIINAIEILGEVSVPVQRPFVTTWKTDNLGTSNDVRISIPTHSNETYNYTVNWGDGTTDSGVTGNIQHDYNAVGTYEVSIWGDFPRIYFNDFFFTGANDSQKILSVEQWGDIEWSNMQRAFQGCKNLDIVAMDVPNLANVSTMSQMFEGCTELKGTLAFNDWDVSNVAVMSWLFKNAESFNQNIGNWDISNVWRTWGMFENASSFNQDIGGWDVSNVSVMLSMFIGAETFNQDIGEWDVSKVDEMGGLFANASAFNQDIGDWDVSGVSDMLSMFSGAENFNQDIGGWDVSDVSYMDDMFHNAAAFDQDLGGWDVSGITWNPNAPYEGFGDMFTNSGLSNENYDKILIGWSQLQLRSGDIVLSAPQNQYCEAQGARQFIINTYGWTINDAGIAEDCGDTTSFVTTWKTDNEGFSEDNQITIPTVDGETYNYSVDWGDGTTDENVVGKITHTYTNSGTYRIAIAGDFPRLQFFPNSGAETDYGKILTIEQWGDLEWTSMFSAFMLCFNLDVVATDVPNLSNVQSMSYMFSSIGESLVGNDTFSDWDVSNVTDMSQMFEGAKAFNQDIGDWDVSNVTNMSRMFLGADAFDQDIGDWDVSNVTNMSRMFVAANAFNHAIGDWDVSHITDMSWMFYKALAFDKDIGDWNVSNVTQMVNMFLDSGLSDENYNNALSGWSQLSSLQNEVTLDAPQNQYCDAEQARQHIIDTYGWTINDAGKAEDCDIVQDFALRINTGGSEIIYEGETFEGDSYFDTGNILNRSQTGVPLPFQTFRYSPSQEMAYAIPVPNGEYRVNLFLAELWFGAIGGGAGGVGNRVFDITIEGQLVQDNYDVYAEVGSEAIVKSYHSVIVADGVLNIDFDSRDVVGGERHPIINAIEILGTDNGLSGKSIVNDTALEVNHLILSPNPVVSNTTLSFEKRVQLSDIQVFDVSGRLVRTFKGTEVSTDGVYKIKVNDLESGTYFINAIDNQGIKHQKQMVINK